MKLFLSIFIIVLVSCSDKNSLECNYISDYYPYKTKAEIEYYEGNYEKAYELYKKAFKHCEALKLSTHHDTDNFARICIELDQIDLAVEYIEKSISKGATLKQFLRDSAYDELFESKEGQLLISKYSALREEYLGKLNLKLRHELQEMIKLDQQYNMTILQDSMFTVNEIRLKEIFERHGFPNEQVIGNYGVDQTHADPTILLLHTSDSIRQNYFIPILKKMIKSGECSPLTLGMVLDNMELFNNRPQTHGTYKTKDGLHSTMIMDTSEVNANRKEIGLPSIKMAEKLDSLIMQHYKVTKY